MRSPRPRSGSGCRGRFDRPGLRPFRSSRDVSVLVVWDELSFDIKDWEGRVEEFPGGDSRKASVKLIARLLGGTTDDAPEAPTRPVTPKKVHTVKVSRETAGRRGKGVTVVSELPLTGDQLKELATKLKNACGTGGTAKDGRIEIQGDQRDRVIAELEQMGYKVKARAGERYQIRSTIIATALPPPRHSDARPRRLPWRCSAWTSVVSTRAPLAPIGWPSATAPPWTFTFASSSSSSFPHASICAANASFSSNRSMSRSQLSPSRRPPSPPVPAR